MSEPITYSNVIDRFLEAVPEYRDYPNNDLAFYKDEPDDSKHIVFGSITGYIVKELRGGHVGRHSAFKRALDFMEQAMSSKDLEVQNLVWCSFLENLHIAEADYDRIKALLGPELTKTLAEIEKQDRETHWKRP